jgi:hypothetical protein
MLKSKKIKKINKKFKSILDEKFFEQGVFMMCHENKSISADYDPTRENYKIIVYNGTYYTLTDFFKKIKGITGISDGTDVFDEVYYSASGVFGDGIKLSWYNELES